MGPTKITPEDQQFNISFVAEVKKYPCLFDSNSSEYKQAQMQDKAWQSVSLAVNESLEMCKKRWRNLRCCMTRYLKSVRDSSDSQSSLRRKPYYLYNHMQFVIPYLKMRDEGSSYDADDTSWIKTNTSTTDGMMKHDEECEDEQDIESIEVQEQDQHQQIKQSIIQSIKILPIGSHQETHHHQQHDTSGATFEIIEAPPTKQPRIEHVQSAVASSPCSSGLKKDISLKQYYSVASTQSPIPCYTTTQLLPQQQATPQQSAQLIATTTTLSGQPAMMDADNNFFKSLIPDIQSMTMEQKRKLKIGILRLIDEILGGA